MTAPSQILTLTGVTKRFGGLTAVDDVSIFVDEGEIVGIIGPNGSGKTTLFSTISGFLMADAGEIEFAGTSLTGLRPFRICDLGLVRTFQIVEPFGGLTVMDNILVGGLHGGRSLREARARAEEVVDFVGLADRRFKKGSELTLVDRKRLELARALATGPKLLLLDEIMAGLRPVEVDMAVEFLRKVQKSGVTIVLVEHLMRAVLALSGRLYALHHGQLIAEGLPEDVIHQPAVVDAYFGEAHAGS